MIEAAKVPDIPAAVTRLRDIAHELDHLAMLRRPVNFKVTCDVSTVANHLETGSPLYGERYESKDLDALKRVIDLVRNDETIPLVRGVMVQVLQGMADKLSPPEPVQD